MRWSASSVRSSSDHVVCHHDFVRRTQCLEDRDGLVTRCSLDGQLDVGQHPVGVGVGDQQRAALAGGGGGELVAVDEPHAGLDRIDAEPGVCDVEERHRRKDREADVGGRSGADAALAQIAHGAFEDERRAGHRVQDLAVLAGGVDQGVGDLDVDVVERVGRFVHVVERGCVRYQRRRRMPPRAQEADVDALDRLDRLDGDVVGAARVRARRRRCCRSRSNVTVDPAGIEVARRISRRLERRAPPERSPAAPHRTSGRTGRSAGRRRCRRSTWPVERTPHRRRAR